LPNASTKVKNYAEDEDKSAPKRDVFQLKIKVG
jgi:hypothetical protein